MTLTVSPLLKNQINNNGRGKKANHEKVYEDLKKHANKKTRLHLENLALIN